MEQERAEGPTTTPRTHTDTDPPGDRRRALAHAKRAATKAADAEAARNGAMLLAADTGASLREIAEATGIPHVTVGRILERAREHRGAPEEILGEECPACGRPNGLIPIDDRDEGLPRSATRWACGCGYFVDRPLA